MDFGNSNSGIEKVCGFSFQHTLLVTDDGTERLVGLQHQYRPNFLYVKSNNGQEGDRCGR